MKVIVIGGSGHIGSYLIPRLVTGGHRVVNMSRGRRTPYTEHPAWSEVEHVHIDRLLAEREKTFAREVGRLNPDVLIDLICFEPESARLLVEELRGNVQQLLMCGTIWVHGHGTEVPTVESQPKRPFGSYGIKKAEIEQYLLDEARRNRFPACILHPGHIVGPGWAPVNPAGNFNTDVFRTLARGGELVLPDLGLETVHHVHADDVAQAFVRAMNCWSAANGESFHVVSEAALTLRGYAEAAASWFGKKPVLRFLPWEEWKKTVSQEDAQMTWDHISHSPCMSIDKAKRLLAYRPRFSSLQAVFESVQWLLDHGVIDVE